ncbi:MAG: hypothetical protein M1822_009773 [Bathelium mastoideum]|nr:MAG: hypothetical protein M1822_009773 [Bathelium mastoideum]
MLDPLSAFSVGAAVVQFVDYGTKLASKTREIATRGSTKDNDEIEKVTIQLRSLSESAKQQSHSGNQQLSGPEEALNSIAFSCRGVADELIAVLNELKLGASRNVFKSIRHAYKTEQEKDKIARLQNVLEGLRVQMGQQLLFLLRERSSKTLQRLDQLVERDKRLESSITNELDQLRAELLSTLKNGNEHNHNRLRELLFDVAAEGVKAEKQQRILFSLHFNAIRARHARIRETHKETFAWIFAEPASLGSPGHAFVEWLRTGSGIFWISGKAGSGKSTLIKYLCDHSGTNEALKHWTESDLYTLEADSGITAAALRHQSKNTPQLVTASHFFWSNGNRMQKSQEGLLQTLLYDVLRQCSDLIETVCPFRWKADGLCNEMDQPWTLKEPAETIKSLHTLPLLSQKRRLKFCFFIDGLDEYKGEHGDIINLLRLLTTSTDIKVCVSSRPWNVFEDAFGKSHQMLVLQDLTHEDIRRYVNDILQDDPQFKTMQERDNQCPELVQEILEKAQGVFLWV